MELIKRKILKNNNNKNIIINLSNSFNISGLFNESNIFEETNKNKNSVVITGICDSRLNEIKKYIVNENLTESYIQYNGSNNGLILNKSNDTYLTYIIDNITFIDNLIENKTNFSFFTKKINNINNYIKFVDDKYLGFIDIKIDNKLVVDRQDINILENHYRLNAIRNINDFEFYGSGFFNIYNI